MQSDRDRQSRQWPLPWLTVAYGISFVLAAVLLPVLDGRNGPRAAFYAAVSLVYWLRILIASKRRETGRDYRFYVAAIMLCPIAWFLLERVMGA